MKHCSTCERLFADRTQACPEDGTTLRLVEDIAPGMILRGKYLILEWIGSGGMASVYRARHQLLNEERAIKMVLPKFSSDKDFLKRFRREAAVARKLRHENAVWVEDLDEIEDGRPFIAMEFLRGRDLRALIEAEGPLSVERTLDLASQIASALSAAHELGIVHRDIKPDNILITIGRRGQEVAKVLDFGIAKAKEADPEAAGAAYTPTKTGMIVGTPGYISPEQAMGKSGDKLDGRADIYSLGIVIYEMLTGRLPFESDTPMGMLLHHLQTRPQPPHELAPARIPKPVSMVLMKALEKQPEDRFQTADELMQALRNPAAFATVVGGSNASTAPTQLSGEAALVTYVPKASKPPAAAPGGGAQSEAVREKNIAGSAEKHGGSGGRLPGTEVPTTVDSTSGEARPFFSRLVPRIVVAVLAVAAVVGIVSQLGPRSDQRIREEILQKYSAQPNSVLSKGKIGVSVSDGLVTLEGFVGSTDEKELACSLAKEVSGVLGCVNNITAFDASVPRTTQRPTPPKTEEGTTTPARTAPSVASSPMPTTDLAAELVSKALTVKNGLARAQQLRDNGKYDDAIATYQRVLAAEPNNGEAIAGIAAARKGKQDEENLLLGR